MLIKIRPNKISSRFLISARIAKKPPRQFFFSQVNRNYNFQHWFDEIFSGREWSAVHFLKIFNHTSRGNSWRLLNLSFYNGFRCFAKLQLVTITGKKQKKKQKNRMLHLLLRKILMRNREFILFGLKAANKVTFGPSLRHVWIAVPRWAKL